MPISTIDRQSDTLIVYFGPMPGKIEFYKTFETLGHSIIYVIDENKSWYSKDEFSNQGQFLEILEKEISTISFKRVIFSGISMGGYAALRFGSVLRPDKIVVFSPQVDLTVGKVRKYSSNIDISVLGGTDLTRFVQKQGTYSVETEIHVGESEGVSGKGWADLSHAKIFCDAFPSARKVIHSGIHAHNVSVILKKNATISELFK